MASIDFGKLFEKGIDATASFFDKKWFTNNPEAASAYYRSLAGPSSTPQRSEPSGGSPDRQPPAAMKVPDWVWPVGVGLIAYVALRK